MSELQNVVFVVIGRNEGERLQLCLHSILTLSTAIVYADSASTDGSVELARLRGAVVVEITTPPFNAARGRSEGLAAARREFPHCDLVQFIDGDCLLDPAWPGAAVRYLRANPDAAAVFGRRKEAYPERSFYNRLADCEWNTPPGPAETCGGDSMMRIAALEAAGGFDVSLMASEEPELCYRLRRLGWRIWRLDCDMTEHDAAIFIFGQWWRRTVRSGFGYAQAWARSGLGWNGVAASQLRSAFAWIVLLPFLILLGSVLLHTILLLLVLPAAYLVQIARIARRYRGSSKFKWKAGTLMMIAKAAELLGAARCAFSSGLNRPIEYK